MTNVTWLWGMVPYRAAVGERSLWLGVICGCVVLLSGCAARGPLYFDDPINTMEVATDAAQLVVYRTKASTQYSGIDTTIVIDGNDSDLGSVSRGGFSVFPVVPGTHIVNVGVATSEGSCTAVIEAGAGSRSFLEVSPRIAHYAATGLAPSVINLASAFFPPAFLGALAVWAVGEHMQAQQICGGAFEVKVVDATTALDRLRDLRASR